MSLLAHSPRFDLPSAERLAADLFGIRGTATPLTSERDQNFLIETANGERHVLKIANSLESRALLEGQNAAMAHLGRSTPNGSRAVASLTGNHIEGVTAKSGVRHHVRLLTWIPGRPLGAVRRHSPELLRDLGRAVGAMDHALEDFDHAALHREFHWDLRTGLDTCRQYVSLVADLELRQTVERVLANHERQDVARLARLPISAIHGDANDYNVIVAAERPGDAARSGADAADHRSRDLRVTGLVDLGDMVVSYTVGDLAVAIAYAVLDKPDPLAAAACITAGYHEQRPLVEDELAALWDLVCLRLCLSVCIGAHQTRERPADAYLAVSQQAARRTLPRLAQLPPRLAEAALRNAVGFEPARGAGIVCQWLRDNRAGFAPVLGTDRPLSRAVVLDLGVGGALISGDAAQNAEPVLTARIAAAVRETGAEIGVGRYGEARLLYDAPAFATGRASGAEHRTVHLGIDLFAQAGTPVHAPLDGTVHAFANNAAPLDYGPVIVLAHRAGDGAPFFTLFGHLAVESLRGLEAGQHVTRGERIAALGAATVNGGWTPHLHFQLLVDTLDLRTDFPGVAPASQRPVWQSLSPDPSPLLGLGADANAPAAGSRATTLASRRAHLGRNVSLAYDEPLKIERGWMQYLFDDDGRRYLDAINNVPHVGHSHPKVVRAALEQMAVLNTNTRYLHDLVNQYAERLCATLDPSLSVCWFVNSGSEANELALRLARAHTGSVETIVLDAAYHGNSTTLIEISPYKHRGPGGAGTPPWVHVTPLPDVYRGAHKRDDGQAGAKYAGHVAEAVAAIERSGKRLGAFIAESCPSVGGQIVPPPGYLRAAYAAVRRAGGVCIADEVQTGLGRMGTHFWAFEAQGVVPDIVVLGKPLGNGHPIGAVITTPQIAARFDNGMEFFSTFGGNPVSAATGLAVLDVVRDEHLQIHALRVGERMLAALRELAQRHPIVGDVRGSGLFIGLECVRDRVSLEPAASAASYIVNRMREEGVLLGTDGPLHNVIKIRPPMPFSEADGDRLVETLAQVLDEEFSS